MEPFRLDAVAARVVAWHNKHPLARRITAAQVQSVGYVALPYQLPGVAAALQADAATADASADTATDPAAGGSLRERALARARQPDGAAPPASRPVVPTLDTSRLQPTFDEDFISPLKPRQVARWGQQQGQPLATAPADAPLRRVQADAPDHGAAPVTLYLLTAAIEAGKRRSRVLLGAGAQAPVLGRRLWSLPRVAATVLTPLLLVAAGLGLALRPAETAIEMAADSASASSSSPSPASTSSSAVVADAHAAHATDHDEHAASAAEAGAVHAAAPAETPADAHTGAHAEAHAEAPAEKPAQGHADSHAVPPAALPPATHTVALTAPPASAPLLAASPAASAVAVATAPLDVEPQRGVINLPRLGRVIERPEKVQDKPAAPPRAEPVAIDKAAAHDAAPAPAATAGPTRVAAQTPALAPTKATATTPTPTTPPKAEHAAAAAEPTPRPSQPPRAEPPSTTRVATAAKPTDTRSAARAEPPSTGAAVGAFAISTRPLRTRAEAEQVMAAMGAVLRTVGEKASVQVEILPQGPDWRVVGWPYLREGDAEKARGLLAARGMRVAVVGF